MKKFWEWAVILMTATMAAGLATSCEEKDNTEPEEEPQEELVTIRKTWLIYSEEDGYYAVWASAASGIMNTRSMMPRI